MINKIQEILDWHLSESFLEFDSEKLCAEIRVMFSRNFLLNYLKYVRADKCKNSYTINICYHSYKDNKDFQYEFYLKFDEGKLRNICLIPLQTFL